MKNWKKIYYKPSHAASFSGAPNYCIKQEKRFSRIKQSPSWTIIAAGLL